MEGQRGQGGLEGGLRLIALVFYAVGVIVVLAVANTSLAADEDFSGTNRMALSVVAGCAVILAAATLFLPWRRLPRDAFFVVPAAGTVLIAACTYYSEGWNSFAYGLYVLAASFFGLYFPYRVKLGMTFLLLAGSSTLLYDPNLAELAAVRVPVLAVVTFVSSYVVREIERGETARRTSEEELVEEKARTMELRRMADTDGLTGLANQRRFRVRLAEEMERDRRMGGEGFFLLFIDLDAFKAINDEHGHLMGDEALRLVARILREGSRRIDVLARYGGEGFVALLPGTNPGGARTLYYRAREVLLARSRRKLGFPLRLSAGAVVGGLQGHRRAPESRGPCHVRGETGRQGRHLREVALGAPATPSASLLRPGSAPPR